MATFQRAPAAPEIPTFVEQGLSEYLVDGWFSVVAFKGPPLAEAQRIHAAIVTVFNDPEVKEAMGKQGNAISVGPLDKAMPFFLSERAKYAVLVKKAGVEAQ